MVGRTIIFRPYNIVITIIATIYVQYKVCFYFACMGITILFKNSIDH